MFVSSQDFAFPPLPAPVEVPPYDETPRAERTLKKEMSCSMLQNPEDVSKLLDEIKQTNIVKQAKREKIKNEQTSSVQAQPRTEQEKPPATTTKEPDEEGVQSWSRERKKS